MTRHAGSASPGLDEPRLVGDDDRLHPLLVANGLAVNSDQRPAFVLFLLWTLVTAVVLLRSAMTAEQVPVGPLAARALRRA